MGCDIHTYVECRVNGLWERQMPEGEGFSLRRGQWELGRNYMLFGILAGVRNRDVLPISEPRGLPEDCSKEIRERHEEWSVDAHSTSYFLISELLDAREHVFEMKKYFDFKDYVSYKETGKPEQWFSSYLPMDFELISNEEMDRRVEQAAFWGGEKLATEVTWLMKYKDVAEYFWEKILPKMAELDPDPANVRMVFWFDN